MKRLCEREEGKKKKNTHMYTLSCIIQYFIYLYLFFFYFAETDTTTVLFILGRNMNSDAFHCYYCYVKIYFIVSQITFSEFLYK